MTSIGTSEAGGFVKPVWTGNEDVAARLEAMPKGAVAKGMFLAMIADTLAETKGPDKTVPRYVRFKDYPLRDFVELAVAAARVCHPGAAQREALRRFGQQVYPVFAHSMVGNAIFSIAARDWPTTLRLAARAYPVSIKPGTVVITSMEAHRAVIELRDVWSFPETYQVGVFEGAMSLLGVAGEIQVRPRSLCDTDLLITWR
ncbi:MAG: DUF2378 family protein [Deltaproteobacteria bacterium]|nr:DUF2378 family protein [Deltaproteobacteria bacterium]